MGYLFLTGATGLLGSYLIRDLLRAGTRLAVLARPSRLASARHRIESQMVRWEKQAGRALPRPVVWEGDITQPDLGLDERGIAWVRQNVTSMMHNAASLTFQAESPESEPYISNVTGTQNVLDFCRKTEIREFFHVSTAYIAGLRTGRVYESELDVGQEHGNDYEISKTKSEKMVREADFIDRLTVFRPGIILGDSKDGYTGTFHGFYVPLKLIAASIKKSAGLAKTREDLEAIVRFGGDRLRELLTLDGTEGKYFVPVDWVSAAMSRIFTDPKLHGETYHLTPKEPVKISLVQKVLEENSLRYTELADPDASSIDWAEFEKAFYEGMGVYKSYWNNDPEYDCTNIERALPDLPCPKVDADMLFVMCDYAMQSNFGWPVEPVVRPEFDVDEHLKPKAAGDAAASDPICLGLRVSGRGGGEWELRWDDRKLIAINPGISSDCTATYHLNSKTFQRIAKKETTVETGIATGRILVEGNGAAPAAPAAKPRLAGADLETFLIDFVVEQTGYPPEMVEIDADLESDLGIDSIKKAQLFGELANDFDVKPSDDFSLDDFPTLRHVLELLESLPGSEPAAPSTAVANPAPTPQPPVSHSVATSTPAAPVAATPAPAPAAAAPVATGGGLSGVALEEFLVNFVVEQTGYPPEMVELDADLESDLGIDSIKKAQLFGELANEFDVKASDDLSLDDFPTLRHVKEFLEASAPAAPVSSGAVSSGSNGEVVTASAAAEVESSSTGDSLSGPALDEYLVNFVVEQTGYPPEMVELDADLESDLGIDSVCGKSYTVLGGITQPKPLDRTRCPVPDHLIEETHEIHLNLCEVVADAIHDAGWGDGRLSGTRAGVYIGHTPPGMLSGDVTYAKLVAHTVRYLEEVDGFAELAGSDPEGVYAEIVRQVRSEFPDGDHRTGISLSAYQAAAVISQTFGLDGPCMTFDAACASSLRALGHAARALQSGQIDTAIVGGASVCNTDALVLFSAAQSVSATGSRPFDEGADGLVTSEGYVAIAIKTLEKAVADGDQIQAVIRGLGISSDGKGKSLWAPRREGQIEAMRRAYASGINPQRLQFIEAHATSTQVGDATELGALKEVFSEFLPPGRRIPVGSAKANVGHTLESAGLTSLIKTVLALKNGTIPPQINVRKLNAQVDWENLPFYVPTQPVEWQRPEDGSSRMAAVNAFGIGGLNVHVVIDEHAPGTSSSVGTPAASPEAEKALREPIAIIGMGNVLPGARTIDGLWDLFASEKEMIQEVPADRWDGTIGYDPTTRRPWSTSTKLGGFITDFEYDWKAHKVPPKQIQTADPLQFMLLDAADQAFKHAGYGEMNFDKTRCGVLVGTMFGAEFTDQLQAGLHLPQFRRTLHSVLAARGVAADQVEPVAEAFQKLLLKRMPALVDETGSFTASTLASRITKTFDLMGGATAVDAGDASAMAALSSCVDLLRAGDCDLMVCAAGQRAMSFAQYEYMNRKQRLAMGEGAGPFDANASGLLPGEGVGVLLLKRLSDAQRDGDQIHGIIHGIGASMSSSVETAVANAIERSIEASGVSPEDVSLVESAATGIPSRDREEFTAVTKAFHVDRRKEPLLLGTVVGQVGHLVGGSGMVSLLKATAELEHVEMPRNVALDTPASYLTADEEHIAPVRRRTSVSVPREDGRVFAGVNCVSQYNLAYHVLLERPTRVEKPKTATTPKVETAVRESGKSGLWRVVRLSAPTMEQLASSAANAVADASALFASAASATGFDDEGAANRFRLAIVVDRPEDLAERLKLASTQMANPKARAVLGEKGIFIGEVAAERPMVAFLFPGQGSQYQGMLKSLVSELPAAQEALREVDATLQSAGLPSFSRLAWEEPSGEISDVWRTQMSLIAADAIVFAAAWSLGLRADRVAGHSFGELAALCAAGSWSFAEAVKATRGRCASIDACQGENGVMLSTSAPAELLEGLCREVSGRLSVSHCNAPDQTVAGGDAGPVARLAERVKQAGFLAKILDVPAAFHTPLMEPVKQPFARALAGVAMQPPHIPVLSSVTNKYVADPADIRGNLVNQMTQPIDYVGLVKRLAADDVSVFVEVGPRQVLTGLTKRILDDHPATIIACDHPKRNGMQQLLFAKAAMEVVGALDRTAEAGPFTTMRSAPALPEPTTETLSAANEPATDVLSEYGGIHVLRLSGSPYEMGYRHGVAQADEIRRVLRRYADIAGSPWDRVVDLDTLVSWPETFFGADELEELRGIAKGAGVTFSSVVAHNLRLYLDAGSGGIHFAVTAKENPTDGLLHGVNEDLRNGLSVRDCLERHVQVRRPKSGIPHVTFGVVGQVGTLNGINEKGLAVSTAVLLDADPVNATENRRLHTVLVKNVLENASNIDEAIAILKESASMARWGLCLSHHPSDRVCYVEFDGNDLNIDPALPKVIAANHRLMKSVADQAPQPSKLRLDRLRNLLGEDQAAPVSPTLAREALRDRFDVKRGANAEQPNLNMVRRVDNQISIVMQPATGDIWLTPGPTANGHQNEFQQLKLQELFQSPSEPAVDIPVSAGAGSAATSTPPGVIAADQFSALAERIKNDAISDGGKICHRFVLRLLESPLSGAAESRLPFRERCLILGSNPVAETLKQSIESQGGVAVLIPSTDSVETAIAAVEIAFADGASPHLFLTTPFDADAVTSLDDAAWNRRMSRGVLVPFLACQRWYQLVHDAKLTDSASVTAVTSLGGDFGISGNVRSVEGGSLAGLLKDLHLEVGQKSQNGFRTKIVDFSGDSSAKSVVSTLVQELSSVTDAVEVGYLNGARYTPTPVFEPVPTPSASTKTDGGNWVITGGARGITAVVAREIGRRLGAKLHLVGSTPLPEIPETWHELSPAELKELRASVMKEAHANGEKPVDAWSRYEKALEVDQTLREFAAMGVSATYHACDVGNRAALQQVLDAVRQADGPITGIVHGAGFERAGRFDKKRREFIERTFLPKLNGAAALMQLTQNDPLEHFIAFSSVAGRFGAVGQADYASANEMLGKLVDWFRTQRPECHSTSFYWHLWGEVGMAVRPETKGYFEALDMNFLPTAEGVNHLIDETLAGMPEPEIVVTDWKLYRFHSLGDTSGIPGMTKDSKEKKPAQPKLATIDAFPMLDRLIEHTPGVQLKAEVHLDPQSDPFLAQHRFKGRPLMPLVATLETMTQAAQLLAGSELTVTAVRDVEILNGLRFPTDEVQNAKVHAEFQGNEIICRWTCDLRNRSGKLLLKDRLYLQCVVEVSKKPPMLRASLPQARGTFNAIPYPETDDAVIYHGASLRTLQDVAIDGDDSWGHLIAPDPRELGGDRAGKSWIASMSLFDGCFYASGVTLWFNEQGAVSVPSHLGRVALGRQPRPGERCTVYVQNCGRDGNLATYDFSLFGDDGAILLQAATEVALEVQRLGRQAYVIKADVGEEEDVESMIDYVKEQIGRLDIIVSNAATGGFRPLLASNAGHFHTTMNINVLSLVFLVKAALPLLQKGESRGKVVTISSHGSHMALPMYGLIGGSKAALESVARHLTLEVGDKGVNVNVVKAGLVETDSTRKIPFADRMFAGRTEKSMVGERVLTADDVANAVLFLSSPLSDLVQGETITVDGGSAIHV
eukprot:g8383.t1